MICLSSCLSSVIFWFYCYVHYLRSRHNGKYFIVPVWAFSVVEEFISTFNVWVNLRFSAQIKAIRVIRVETLRHPNIVSHNHTFRHAGSYKKRIVLTFVKPRAGEGRNGRLKCPMGFLVNYQFCKQRRNSYKENPFQCTWLMRAQHSCPITAIQLQKVQIGQL